MDKNLLIINGIILFYILQRVSEIFISKKNEAWLKLNNEAYEVDPDDGLIMKAFHSSWFIALIIESNYVRSLWPPVISISLISILIGCMWMRFHTMRQLKQFWTIKILAMNNQSIITSGLYKYLRHPNYLVVIIEFIVIPLLFKAYWVMLFFTIANFIVLYRRINLEETTLMKQTNYREVFSQRKRILPFLFLAFISFATLASENNFHFGDYEEAKKSTSFIKFESTSTKLGFITSTFDGYAKEIKINYLLNADTISQLEVQIPVKSLDTDINSRNEKMHSEILESEKYPHITITIAESVKLSEGDHSIDMVFTIKDKKIKKSVNYSIKKVNDKLVISGSLTLGLKEMGLPDPSIAIAKVRDNFDLKFSVIL